MFFLFILAYKLPQMVFGPIKSGFIGAALPSFNKIMADKHAVISGSGRAWSISAIVDHY